MRIFISTFAVIALGLAIGCQTRNESRAQPRDVSAMTDEQLAEASIVFMADLVAAGKPHEGDCAQMAKAMMRVVEVNEDIVAATRAYRRDPTMRDWFEQRYGKRVKPMSIWLSGALSHCGNRPAMRELMDKMK